MSAASISVTAAASTDHWLIVMLSILWTIGIILLIIGVVLFLLGTAGRQFGGRKYWY